MNQFLFGVIATLMLAIVGVGATDVVLREQEYRASLSSQSSISTLTAQINELGLMMQTLTLAVATSTPAKTATPVKKPTSSTPAAVVTAPVKTVTQPTPTPTPAPVPTPAPEPVQAPGTYTLAQIAEHNSDASCYTAINGSVFDLTSFIREHPGGSSRIRAICGIDGSNAYNDQHGGERRPANELASFKIGTLI